MVGKHESWPRPDAAGNAAGPAGDPAVEHDQGQAPAAFAQSSDELQVRRAHRSPSLVMELETLYTTSVTAGTEADIVTLAKKLGVSARSLQRRLKSEGTSHRSLLARARATAARTLLKSSDLTIDAVAKRVGFSERRAFERAFRRWTGHTPASYRRGGDQNDHQGLQVDAGDRIHD